MRPLSLTSAPYQDKSALLDWLVAAVRDIELASHDRIVDDEGVAAATTTATTALAVETAARIAADALKANIASPTLTGTPAAPTAAPGTNTTQIATTAYATAADALKANLASPTFTGVPAAPTAAANNNSTQLSTTAYVDTADALKANLASPTFTGVPAVPTAAAGTNTTQAASTAFVIANGTPWTRVVKTADQSITSSTTLVDDTALQFSMAANTKYIVRGMYILTAGSGGHKFSANGPASPTRVRLAGIKETFASGTPLEGILITAYGTPLWFHAGVVASICHVFEGVIQNGANAGTFAMRIAQNSSNANATTFEIGSYIEYSVIA